MTKRTEYHVAIDHLESPNPDTPEQKLETTYLGTVDQAHVDEVRAIAELEDSPRFVKDHPHIEGAFCVLREDGYTDVYVPTDATEYRVYDPDPLPKTRNEGGDLAADDAQSAQTKSSKEWQATLEKTGPNTWDVSDESGTVRGELTALGDLPRGASGPAYISGVTRFGDQSIGGAMDTPGNPPRATWHTTESPAGGGYFASIGAYLVRVAAEPQVIYDPVTDKLGQFGPLTQSGRALRNDGSRRTNREGKVNIQVEVLGRAKTPWTKGFDPSKKPNYRKLIAAMRAHGIPDVWPAGKPPATATAAAKGSRSRTTWQTKGGHYGHSQVPNNDHWDPGAIDTAIVPGKPVAPAKPAAPTKPSAKPTYEPFPGSGFFHGGRHSPLITAMGRRLVAEGCGKYRSGPGPNWTNTDKASFAAWQRKYSKAHGLNWSAEDCNGIPGKTSWDALKVPNV